MSKNSMLINPVKTSETVNRAISTPDFMGNFGIETSLANIIEKNAYKYQELRDEEQIQYAKSYILDRTQAAQDYQLGLKTDDSYYKSGEKYKAYLEESKEKREAFEKLIKEKGIKPEIADAAIAKVMRQEKETEAIQGKFVTDYYEKKNKERNILLYDENSKALSKSMLNGNFIQGKEFYENNIQTLLKGLEKGYISADQMVDRANRELNNLLVSEVYSYINTADGIVKLNEMANMSYEDFYKSHEGLVRKYGNYSSELTYSNYEIWKQSISGAVNKINARNSANEKKNLYKELVARNEMLEKPVEYVTSKYAPGTQKSTYANEILTETTNIKYGTNFTSLEEHIKAGHKILSVDKTTSLAPLYETASGPEIMQARIHEKDEWGAECSEEVSNAIADGAYLEMAGKVLGGVGIELYKTNYEFKVNQDWLYSAENIKCQKMLPNIDLSPETFMDSIKTNYGKEINKAGPIVGLGMALAGDTIKEVNHIFNPEKFLTTLHDMAIFGDAAAERMYADIKGQYTDLVKTMIIHKTGGILSQDLAEELDIKSYNVTIESLTPEEKRKVFNYFVDDSKGLFEGKEYEEVKNKFVKNVEIWGKDYQTVDLGTAGTIITDKSLKGQDIQDVVSLNLDRKREYYLSNRKTKVPRREIKIETRLGSNILMPTYAGQPLYDENGNQIIFDLGEIKDGNHD